MFIQVQPVRQLAVEEQLTYARFAGCIVHQVGAKTHLAHLLVENKCLRLERTSHT